MLAKVVCFAAVVMGSIAPVVRAQQSAYGQCGGIGWTGATTCVSGYTCVYSNDYYSQCVPGTASVASATKTSSTIKTSSTSTKAASSTATVYLAGDSTMAKGGAGDGDTDGWGQYLSKYITLAVVNDAVGGRSARSYTREGRFTTIINTVKSGDYVVIEFGHNDGGSLTPTDNGRTDCPGAGSETCQTTYDGVAETVLTFPAYLINAANSLKAKGANVIISSQTPDNPWETGTFSCTANRFQTYAQSAASTSGSSYTDHWTTTCNVYQHLGATVVDSYYPNDHTHTSPTGADVVAQAFVRGLLCSSSTLKSYVNSAGNAVYGSC